MKNSAHDPLASDAARADSRKAAPEKREYQQPRLTAYGRVKDLTHGDSGPVGDGPGMNMMRSERALKERVIRIGTHPWGFGLYLFDYKPEFRDACGHGRQFGVMADEVERVCPEAVRYSGAGHRLVDYARLGVTRARG